MEGSIDVESLPPIALFETKNQPPDKFPGTENNDPPLAKQGEECVKEGSINPMLDTDVTDIPEVQERYKTFMEKTLKSERITEKEI